MPDAATIKLASIPNEEAKAFWARKTPLKPGAYNALSEEAKTLAFGVSGIAREDELATVMNAMGKALADGTDFRDFKAECAAVFERRGWTGDRAWRVDNIFRTNIQTAYNVGRWKQVQETADERPYLQYDAVMDSATRPDHAAMNGRVWRIDDPVWDVWMPPNGFRCRCGVRTLSAREVEREGLAVETDDPSETLVEPIDPVSGNKMPAMRPMPDPGFSHNPGRDVWGGITSAPRPAGLPKVPDWARDAAFYRRKSLANVAPKEIPDFDAGKLLPAGKPDEFYLAEVKKRWGNGACLKDAAGQPVVVSERTWLVDKDPKAVPVYKFGKGGHGPVIPVLEDMLADPYEIWVTPQEYQDGRIRLTRRYICLWKTADKSRIGGLAVFEVEGGEFQGVTAWLPLKGKAPDLGYVDRQRRGMLLYKAGK